MTISYIEAEQQKLEGEALQYGSDAIKAGLRRCRTFGRMESVRPILLGRRASLLGCRSSLVLPNQGCLLVSCAHPQSALKHALAPPPTQFCKASTRDTHVPSAYRGTIPYRAIEHRDCTSFEYNNNQCCCLSTWHDVEGHCSLSKPMGRSKCGRHRNGCLRYLSSSLYRTLYSRTTNRQSSRNHGAKADSTARQGRCGQRIQS